MRALFAALLLTPALATAQPTAADSALVDRVIEALGLDDAERRAASGLSIGAFDGPFAPDDLVSEQGAIADSVRAAFARDGRPDLLREALTFLESPAYSRVEAASLVRPGATDGVSPSALADSALAARYAEAAYRAMAPDDAQGLLFVALLDLVPDDAPPALRQSLSAALDRATDAEARATVTAVMARAARRSLADVPETDVVAATAYYASDAGRYVGRHMALGTARAQIPVIVRTVGPMFASLPDAPAPDAEARFEVVDSGFPRVMRALQQAVVYPESARREGVEGIVVVEIQLAMDGSTSEPRVIRSPDPRLSRAALAAVATVDFAPVVRPEQQGTIPMTFPVMFRLGEAHPLMAVPVPAGAPVYRTIAKVQEAVVYPESARAEGVGGEVTVRLVLDRDGSVVDATVVRSPDERLSQAVLEAIRSVRFDPPDRLTDGGVAPVSFPVTFDPTR